MADPINILSLCSGVGMLDLGVAAGLDYLGFAPRHVGYCERDAYAASCLMARMEDASLEPAPVFCGDMRDLDALPLRGRVDLVCAGLPCQPYSTAGKQRGLDDHRSYGDGDGPIPHFLRIVAECRPALVFCENVPPWVRGGWFRPVGEELCRLGYKLARPLFITAESVGASHKRERVFVLAHAAGIDDRQRRFRDGPNEAAEERTRNERGHCIITEQGAQVAVSVGRGFGKLRQPPGSNGLADGGDEPLADAERIGGGAGQPRGGSSRGSTAGRTSEAMGHAQRAGPQGRRPGLAERRGEFVAPGRDGADVALFAPGPSGDWQGIDEAIWPAIKPGFRVLADGRTLVVDASRADQLRCGGNGCVPLQAAVALVELMREVMA